MFVEQTHLRNITNLFYRGDYQEGITEISTFIQQNPCNSNLYTNRALFLAQLNNDEEALKDLHLALSINPRNYISYFNIFSIKIKQELDQEAYQHLCCSLSCLYLLKAKESKQVQDANRSISFSNNNFEAYLLKGLIQMELSDYLEAVKSFQQALKYNALNKIILHLRRIAISKINPELRSTLNIKDQFSVNLNEDWRDFTLKSSVPLPSDQLIYDKIEQRLTQFNRLYNEINNSVGAVTHKVPKDIEQVLQSRDNHEENVIIIRDSGVKTPKNNSQLYPEPGNVFIRLSQAQSSAFHSIIDKQESIFKSIADQDRNDYQLSRQHDQFSSVLESRLDSVVNHGKEFDQFQEIIQKTEEKVNILNGQYSFLSISQINKEQMDEHLIDTLQRQDMQQELPIKQSQKYNIIYPLDQDMLLKMKVLNVEFISQPEQLAKYNHLYCIISYNLNKTKLKTQSKPCLNEQCTWDQQFAPMNISTDPSDMTIKLYNKKHNAIRDEFLGDLEVLITTADKLLLPLHNKKGQCIGSLLIELQLVQKVNNSEKIVPAAQDN